jgi:hypothetical protein
MTHSRNEYLSERFNEFLDRFSPPRSIQNNPKAMQQDADAMLSQITRAAPGDGYEIWFDAMIVALGENMTTRSWPAPGELAKACKSVTVHRTAGPSGPQAAWAVDPYENVAAKMKAGGAVPEGFLYGREACELIVRRLVDLETMTRYRSAAFFTRKDQFGEGPARQWEVDAKASHEAAKAVIRDKTPAHAGAPQRVVDAAAKAMGIDYPNWD